MISQYRSRNCPPRPRRATPGAARRGSRGLQILDAQPTGTQHATYYEREYPTLRDFLERRYGLPETLAATLSRESEKGRLIGRGYVFCGGDYTVGQWLGLEAGKRALRRILQCTENAAGEEMEEPDEDQE